MQKKQKLTALVLAVSLSAVSTAFAASGAPTSQFGFKGWPYRQNSYCPPVASTCTPVPSATPTPTAEPTIVPTETPAPTAAPVATPVPTAVPTASPAPTAAPTAVPTPKPTQKPVETAVPPSNEGDYTTGSVTAQEENAFLLLNQDRSANGMPALTLDPVLCELARLKSRDMHEKNYFAHTSPTYGSASQMLKTFGYSFNAVGENIAHHATVEKSQAAFMSSTGHRRNILSKSWTKVGIGVWKDSQGFVYVTQLFVR